MKAMKAAASSGMMRGPRGGMYRMVGGKKVYGAVSVKSGAKKSADNGSTLTTAHGHEMAKKVKGGQDAENLVDGTAMRVHPKELKKMYKFHEKEYYVAKKKGDRDLARAHDALSRAYQSEHVGHYGWGFSEE